MISASVQHGHGIDGARTRLQRLFDAKQIACEWAADGLSVVVSKQVPLVGVAQARVKLGATSVEVEVLKAPAFPSAATIQRTIVDELSRVLA